MWGFIFFAMLHSIIFLCFFIVLINKIIKLKSFEVGYLLYISTTLSLLFALSAVLAYFRIVSFNPVQYLYITLFPICVYFIQIIELAIQCQINNKQ